MSGIIKKHWHEKRDGDDVVWLHIDVADASANVLSSEVLNELELILNNLLGNMPKGVIVLSDKKSGFIAGADVGEFSTIKTEEEALALIRRGQSILSLFEEFTCPTVAVINGFCLGGGLELALACRYRVAEDSPSTKLGLPEVMLGIHPGFGGTVRSIPLIGPLDAMNLILQGRAVNAKRAEKLGLVDYAVPERHLLRAAKQIVHDQPRPHKPTQLQTLLNHRISRQLLGKYMKSQLVKKVRKEHYPSPYAIVDLWVKYADNLERMMEEEAKSVAKLIIGDTAQNLVRVFGLQDTLKAQGNKKDFSPKHVHVVGGGVMGGDIAAWCALQGFTVTIQDCSHEILANASKRAYAMFMKKLKKPQAAATAMDRFIPDLNGHGVSKADIIIEAIFENAEVKQDLYKSLEPKMKKGAILATNTSSIPLEVLEKVLKKPDRLVGLHFFNPVAQMQLIEIVRGDKTTDETFQKAAAFARHINKLPLPVISTPGFLVNRILMPYLMEAVELFTEGVPAHVIDKEAKRFGMPMGPIELADTVGLDICLSVAKILSAELGGEVPKKLIDLVEAGHKGKKTGQGFYAYKKGKKVNPMTLKKAQTPSPDIADRLVFRLINEAVACLREGVVADADLLDAGIIFGTGFAPFRGGPMHYIESFGREKMLSQLESLKQRFGERFTPDDGWK